LFQQGAAPTNAHIAVSRQQNIFVKTHLVRIVINNNGGE